MLNNTWNTLLKCILVACFDTHNFQEGKVYEVKNGRLIDGHGRKAVIHMTMFTTLMTVFMPDLKK